MSNFWISLLFLLMVSVPWVLNKWSERLSIWALIERVEKRESLIFGLTEKLLMCGVAEGDSMLEVEMRTWAPILAWECGDW